MYRVLLTGSRFWRDEQRIVDDLADLHHRYGPILHLDHGGCPTGADATADHVARKHGISVKKHPADWDHCTPNCPPGHRRTKKPGDVHHPGALPDYCPGAGPRRNAAMVALRPRYALVYLAPNSRGTAHCFGLIRAAEIPFRKRGRT